MFGRFARYVVGRFQSSRHTNANYGQNQITTRYLYASNSLSSLARDVSELRNTLDQQLKTVQDGLDALESISERLAQVWKEHELLESDYLRVITGILRVFDDCQIQTANQITSNFVLELLDGLLCNQGIEPINVSEGDPFDPRLHQCEETVHVSQQAPGTVVEVVETGYVRTLSSGAQSVIRPARVIVNANHENAIQEDR